MARAWLLSTVSTDAVNRTAVSVAVFDGRATPLVVMHEGDLCTLTEDVFVAQMRKRFSQMMRAAAAQAARRHFALHAGEVAGHA